MASRLLFTRRERVANTRPIFRRRDIDDPCSAPQRELLLDAKPASLKRLTHWTLPIRISVIFSLLYAGSILYAGLLYILMSHHLVFVRTFFTTC